MRTTFLGPTGLRVSELCLGTMTFGTDWGWGADKPTSRRILDAFADAGGNFVDTADIYTNGTSEAILGELLAGQRERWVVGTKYSIATGAGPNAQGNQRKNLIRSLDASLERLRTDYVDLLWVHVWDGFTPVEETLRALDDMVRAGKVLHVGFSDFPAWLVSRADAIADLRGLTRPAAIQVEYNLAAREPERELLPMAEALGLSVLDWSPLGGGALTGKHLGRHAGDADQTVRADVVAHFAGYRTERVDGIARTLVEISADLGASPAQLAIALASPPLARSRPGRRRALVAPHRRQPRGGPARDPRRGHGAARRGQRHRPRLPPRLPARRRAGLVRRRAWAARPAGAARRAAGDRPPRVTGVAGLRGCRYPATRQDAR